MSTAADSATTAESGSGAPGHAQDRSAVGQSSPNQADGHQPAQSRSAQVFVCVKWVANRMYVDPLEGTVREASHGAWFSESDFAAVETALLLAEAWNASACPTTVSVVCVGPSSADDALRELSATGVDRLVRVETGADNALTQPSSAEVARLLAEVIDGASEDESGAARLVICGDVSADRGSGSVPAFLADHLGCAQALGLVEVEIGGPGELSGTRRLDGGRRELLSVTTPAVISVEGAVADLRRASLGSVLASRDAVIEVHPGATATYSEMPVLHPWRPRARVVPAPSEPAALGRIVELTGAKSDRTPPRSVTLDPAEAAAEILDQLREWGYEWGADSQS